MAADRKAWVLFAVTMGAFLTALDGLVLNIALPTLARDLDASTSELQWIVDSYILVFAGLLLVGGSLGDRYGRARVLKIGLVIFGVGSVGAAAASGALALIAWRATMGAGAALIMPTSVAIITNVFTDARQRGRALGVWAAVAGLGLALGPVVGGVLLSQFWWGSIFLVNIPLVAVTLAVGFWAIPESRNPEASSFDPLGVVLSVASVSLLVYTTIQAPEKGWGSTRTLGLFVVTAVLFVCFVTWERRCTHPMLQLDFFRNPRFSAAALTAATASFSFAGIMFVLTQLMQLVFGYSPVAAGLRLLPLAIMFIVGALLGPRLAELIGTKRAVASGLLTFAVGVSVLAAVSVHSGYELTVVAMIGVGIGFGIAAAPNTDAVMGSVPTTKAGVASGTLNTSRQMSNGIGVAVIGSLLVSGYRSALDANTVGLGLAHGKLLLARRSLGEALGAAHDVGGSAGKALADSARDAFIHGMHIGALTSAVLLVIGALLALKFLPAHARQEFDPEARVASLEILVD